MNNDKPIITVIVPVYNVEAYLPRCIDSILAQTFTDFELILVDDESPDRCGEICEAYASKDARIRVIHKKNGGVSAARNTALDVAVGQYIAFCDSDDYWDIELLDIAYQTIESKQSDWVSFRFRSVDDDKITNIYEHPVAEHSFIHWDERINFFIETFLKGRIGWSICARLFRREIIEKYHIRFCETCNNFAEDMGFCGKYLLCANSIVSIDKCLYNYYQRASSMMAQSQTVIKCNELNEISYDIGTFAQKVMPAELYEQSIGLIHYYVMENQYQRLRPLANNRAFKCEFKKIKRRDWFCKNTKATIRSTKILSEQIGKNPARLIAIFSWSALHNNWNLYFLACRFSNYRHSVK